MTHPRLLAVTLALTFAALPAWAKTAHSAKPGAHGAQHAVAHSAKHTAKKASHAPKKTKHKASAMRTKHGHR